MRIETVYSAEEITELAKARFKEERALNHLEGWFLARELAMECDRTFASEPDCIRIGRTLVEVMTRIPLTLGDYHLFAGSQDDAFARSYALINPSFEVKSFEGYCDPVQVFGDISPIGDIRGDILNAQLVSAMYGAQGGKVTIEDAQLKWSTEEDEASDSGDPFAGLEAALLAASA